MASVAHQQWEGSALLLKTLYQLLAALMEADTLDAVYDAALTSLLSVTAADRAAILLFEGDGVIRFQAARGLSDGYRAAVTGHSPWPRGTGDAQPIVIADALSDPSLASFRHVLLIENIRAMAFIPLAQDGKLIGKFMLYYAEPHECPPAELDIATVIAAHVVLATEHMQLELAGRRLAAIVEASEDAIISKDLNGIVTSWNKGAERIFGYSAEEMIGKSISILAAPERRDEMPEILSKIRQGLRVHHYETRRRRKDGQIIDVDLSVSPVRGESGQIAGASKIARDITVRKHSEAERTRLLLREQEARRTAELLNRVASRLSAQLDLEQLTREVIDLAVALVGAEWGALVQNDAGGKSEACAEDAPVLGVPEGAGTVRSYLTAPVVARSGEILGALVFGHSKAAMFTAGHKAMIDGIASQAAIAMDNARLFEQAIWAQTELKRSNEELRRANQDLEMFAYSATHDFQEPLRTVTVSAELIERSAGAALQGEVAGFLKNIVTSSNRLNALLEDLLEYTRATKGDKGPTEYVDSGEVLADVMDALRVHIDESGATITAGPLPTIAMHRSRLTQLLQNLISNAIKYRGARAPRIHVGAKERDGWWVFSVVDNGIGIEAEYAEHIFGLFKRLHGRDQYPGSGIGLAVCQRVVEQYGGRVWLEESAPGEGSTFCFCVPAGSASAKS